ncbi:MAG TPA: Rad52/Rad22 family DNA repair protein [Gemmataceae bacterium]|nr:Rad52/Rad22 family DNA repair protein [Gemmataceae bacterium]
MVARNPERPSFARNPEVRAITEALSVPFDPKDVKFKPQMVKNNRALAMAYIDARLIQDRLDDVLGAEHWQDEYQLLADGSVVCRLRLKLGGRWITKMDVGSPSEQPDVGDRLKAAFSDALKRAAVKFGIGRYLYRLPAQWVDYDPAKKQIAQRPELPAFALPTSKPGPKAAPTKESAPALPAVPLKPASDQKPAEPKTSNLPANGQELHRRLREYDAKLAGQKLCPLGALLAHVTQAGVKAGYSANMSDWTGAAIPFAVDAVKEFEQSLRPKAEPRTAA